MHAKLASSDNVDFVKAHAVTSSDAPAKLFSYVAAVLTDNEGAGSGGSDDLVSPRTVGVAPALVSMRQGIKGSPAVSDVLHQTQQPNVHVLDTTADKSEQPCSVGEDCTTTAATTAVENKGPVVTQQAHQAGPHDRTAHPLIVSKDAPLVADKKTGKQAVGTRKSPRKRVD